MADGRKNNRGHIGKAGRKLKAEMGFYGKKKKNATLHILIVMCKIK